MKLTRALTAVTLVFGLAAGSAAFAQAQPSPSAQPPVQNNRSGMMNGAGMAQDHGMMSGGGAMMKGGGSMMGMMNAMTRMADTCNRMMASASNVPTHPGQPSTDPSHG